MISVTNENDVPKLITKDFLNGKVKAWAVLKIWTFILSVNEIKITN